MKKLLIIFIVTFFCSNYIFAQDEYGLLFRITDDVSNPIDAAYTLAVYNNNNELFADGFGGWSPSEPHENYHLITFNDPVDILIYFHGYNFSDCDQQRELNYTYAEITSGTIKTVTTCGYMLEIFPLHIIDDINVPNEICVSSNYSTIIDLKFGYNWRYSFDNSNWFAFPASFESTTNPIFDLFDLPEFVNLSVLPSQIFFSTGFNEVNDNSNYTNTITYSIIDCSPQLVTDPPTVVPMTCSESNDGGFIAQFDRELDAAQNERMLLYVEKYDENTTLFDRYDIISDQIPILDNSDINNGNSNTYTSPQLLEPGTYRLRWISKYDPTDQELQESTNSAEQSSNFVIDPIPPISFGYSNLTGVSCYGGADGSVTISNIQNGIAPFEYSIDGGATFQNSATFSGLNGGTYTLMVRDSNGCLAQTPVNVTITTPPIPFTYDFDQITEITQNGADDGSIRVAVSGGTGNLTYNWLLNGAVYMQTTTNQITGLGPGVYTVTVEDENACVAEPLVPAITSVTLTEPSALSVNFTVLQSIDCNGNLGSIRAQGVGGNDASYIYAWSNGVTGQDLLNVSAGTYAVTITDANGITFTDSYELTEPEALTVTSSPSNVSCFGGNDGSITLSVAGGTVPYTIAWSDDNSVTSTERANLLQGDYFYTIMDTNGCTFNGSVSITQPAPLAISIDSVTDPTTVGGNDGAIAVTVAGGVPPYAFEWSDEGGTVVANTEDITGLTDGLYTLLVTDANGCTNTIDQRVTEPQPLSGNIIELNPISCTGGNDGELMAEPIGGSNSYSYEWYLEENGSYVSIGLTSQIITDLTSGNYRVVITDTAAATTQVDYTLLDPNPITITGNLANILCYGGSDGAIDITVTGGESPYIFTWTNAMGNTVSTDEDVNSIPIGTYSVFIIDSKGCTAFTDFELVGPSESLWITQDVLTDPSASGATDGTIAITVTGGTPPYTYEWTDSSGTVISTEEDLIGLGEGSYTLTVYDFNSATSIDNSGCIISEDFVLLAPDAMLVTIDQEQGILCAGDATGILRATGTGGYLDTNSVYSYQWFREENGSFTDLGNTTNRITGLSAGVYQVIIKDDNGITASDTYTIAEPEEMTILLTVTNDVSCASGVDGSIDALVQGGTPPYTFSWSNGATTEDISSLGVGQYTLDVTDANGCISSENIELTQPGGMEITSSILQPGCYGGSDGSIALNVSGGTPSYSYLWSTGATAATLNDIAAGSYSVTVTDAAGCISIIDFLVEDPDPLTLDLGEDRVLCSGQSYTIDATIADNGATYEWSSDNGYTSSSPLVQLTDSGVYTLVITNTSGCIAQDSIEITITDEEISADFLVATQAFRNETIVLVDVSDPVPDTIEWIFPEEATVKSQNGDYAEVSFSEEGVYTVTMIAYRGACMEMLSKEITILPQTYEGSDDTSELSFIQKFSIYPNPNSGIFQAEIALREIAPVSIKIINLMSNTVSTIQTGRDAKEYAFDYNLNIAIGAYMVVLETPKGSQVRKMIIE